MKIRLFILSETYKVRIQWFVHYRHLLHHPNKNIFHCMYISMYTKPSVPHTFRWYYRDPEQTSSGYVWTVFSSIYLARSQKYHHEMTVSISGKTSYHKTSQILLGMRLMLRDFSDRLNFGKRFDSPAAEPPDISKRYSYPILSIGCLMGYWNGPTHPPITLPLCVGYMLWATSACAWYWIALSVSYITWGFIGH